MQTETEHPAIQAIPPAVPEEDDESPEAILLRAVSEIPTQPLGKTRKQRTAERRVLLLILLFFLAFVGGSLFAALTYPTVTVEVVPRTTRAATTAHLALATRVLAPVTVTKSETRATTGTGHQDATEARGTLTFYNGSSAAQTIPAGRTFTGADGITVQIDAALTIPANNPPQDGIAWMGAHSVTYGSTGNIAALDIDVAISTDLTVKNLAPFQGGRDARTFQAVARSDLDTLTSTVKTALNTQIPLAFRLQPGEAVNPTTCHFQASATHQAGEEARTVTVTAHQTCQGIAYRQDDLQQQATAALTRQTRPGPHFQLESAVRVTIDSLSPFTVSVQGRWRYALSTDEEQTLAQHIAGDSPQAARAYLLHTGIITRATVSQPLPRDPQHIQLLIVLDG